MSRIISTPVREYLQDVQDLRPVEFLDSHLKEHHVKISAPNKIFLSNISFSVVIQAFFIVSPRMVVKTSQINGWELLLPESFTSCTLKCLTLIKTFVELLQV